MRILVDIGHPAHVHLYRNLITLLKANGHFVIVTVRDIPAAKSLLEIYDIPYSQLGRKSDSITGKAFDQIRNTFLLLKIVKHHKISLAIGSSITIAHASAISPLKSIVLDDDDDDVQPLFVKFAHPFCNTLLSPDTLEGNREHFPTLFYPSYHELAYLHPNRFTPDLKVLEEVGIGFDEPYYILRFNAFKAHHDIGIQGLSLEQKKEIIELLRPYGRVFITNEREIEPDFASYKLNLSHEKIHSLVYYASMFIGDSQTMTTEAAILGTPAFKCNSFAGRLSIPNEIEHKYGLCYSYTPDDFANMKKKINELLIIKDLKSIWKTKRDSLLHDKIDLTDLLVWFCTNYPDSIKEFSKKVVKP